MRGAQLRRQPDDQSERGEPPESRVRGERDRAARVLAREDVAYPALRGRSRCLDYVRHAEACERRLRLVGAPLLEEVARRLGDRAREHEQDEPGRQADEPEEAPARVGNDQRRGVARRDVAADAADRADPDRQQRPLPLRRDLADQGEDDREHSARGNAHEAACRDVVVEARHRAADRRGDEHEDRELDGRKPPYPVGEVAEEERADDGPRQRHERKLGGRADREPVLVPHARDHESEGQRLHRVDHEPEHEDGQELPVSGGQALLLAAHQVDVHLPSPRLAEQREDGDGNADPDEAHADDHLGRHPHAGQPVAHRPRLDDVHHLEGDADAYEGRAHQEGDPHPSSRDRPEPAQAQRPPLPPKVVNIAHFIVSIASLHIDCRRHSQQALRSQADSAGEDAIGLRLWLRERPAMRWIFVRRVRDGWRIFKGRT